MLAHAGTTISFADTHALTITSQDTPSNYNAAVIVTFHHNPRPDHLSTRCIQKLVVYYTCSTTENDEHLAPKLKKKSGITVLLAEP